MKSNFDKVISVPIECDDVSKTVAQLPRHPDDAEIVAVQLKRRLQLKNSHLQEYIRPQVVLKALQTLKEKFANPFYQDIKINEEFLNKPTVEGDEMEVESASEIHERELDEEFDRDEQKPKEQKAKEASENEKEKRTLIIDGEEVESTVELEAKSGTDEDAESEDEFDTRLTTVKKFQSKQENNTCLLPIDMASKIRMNLEKSAMAVPTKDKSIQIAPGMYSNFFLHQTVEFI